MADEHQAIHNGGTQRISDSTTDTRPTYLSLSGIFKRFI